MVVLDKARSAIIHLATFVLCLQASGPALAADPAMPSNLHVQAPYDAYVCFQSTFADCRALVEKQHPSLSELDRSTIGIDLDDVTYAAKSLLPGRGNDQGNTTDNRAASCHTDGVNFTRTFKSDAQYPVVFFSPALLEALSDDVRKDSYLNDQCTRLAYDYGQAQSDFASKKNIDSLDVKIARAESIDKGGRAYSEAMLEEEDTANNLIQGYVGRFSDIQLAIDSQNSSIERDYYDLDIALFTPFVGSQRISLTYYTDGSFVQKGTVVASFAK